jgi:tetratricopeptide (TPR) repeat protein
MTTPPQIANSKLSLFGPKGPPAPATTVTPADMAATAPKKKGPLSTETVVALADGQVDAAFNAEDLAAADRDRNLDAARQVYEKALKKDPKNAAALRGLARLYTRRGDQAQATATYARLAQEYPQDHAARYEQALALARFEDWAGAEAACRQAMAIDPSSLRYGRVLGLCLARQGRYEEGLNALAAVTSEPEARAALAKVFADVGQPDAARQQAELALKADPKCVAAHEVMTQLGSAGVKPADAGVRTVGHAEPAGQ